MNILALDTSTEACSVALLIKKGNHEEIFSRFEIQPNQHSKLLLPMIESVLAEAGISLAGQCTLHESGELHHDASSSTQSIDAIAFGCGPGSFTGLRIAASVTQGMAFAKDIPVIPISSLQCMAQAAYEEFGYKKIEAAIDAHVQSFYYGAFEYDEESGCVERVDEEKLILAADYVCAQPLDSQQGVSEAGEGVYNKYITEADAAYNAADNSMAKRIGSGWRYFDIEAGINYYPRASALLPLAKKIIQQKAWVSAEEALPVYLHELNYSQKKVTTQQNSTMFVGAPLVGARLANYHRSR